MIEYLDDCVGCPQGCISCGRNIPHKVVECDTCGKTNDKPEMRFVPFGNKQLCPECYINAEVERGGARKIVCEECGADESLVEIDETILCPDCVGSLYGMTAETI